MRLFALVVVVASGCSFSASLGGDAPPVLDDSGREIRAWKLATATDFAAGETVDMTIDPRGALTPHGYVYGALLARGVEGMKLWTNSDSNWDNLANAAPVGYGLWTGNDIILPGADLRFVGITNPSMVTVWMEGEIWINGPSETIEVLGDDTAFAYVATDRVTFTKIAQQGTGIVTVPASGWYPIRIGWANGDANGTLDFEITDPVGGGRNNARHDRFRVATSALRGTFRNVYYREVHGGGVPGRSPVLSIDEAPLHAATAFDPPLPGSTSSPATTTPFDWSARWTGQLYAAAAGSYSIEVASKDGSRVVLGGTTSAQNYERGRLGAVTTVATAMLRQGWNDLIVDFNHVEGTPSFAVSVMAAPPDDAALVGKPIPVDRLRPVQPRSDRLITRSAVSQAGLSVTDDANEYVELTTRIDAHPSEIVTSVEVTARVETNSIQQLVYRLQSPDDDEQVRDDLIETADGNQTGSYIVHGVWDLGENEPAVGSWQFGVADNLNQAGTNVTTYYESHVTVHTRGGPDQIAPAATWRSPVIANATAVSQIDHVRWTERAPAGASVVVRMRTCEQADCSDGTWSEPIVNGAAPLPSLPALRHIQLQVEMTSDGTREPELSAFDIQYRTDPK